MNCSYHEREVELDKMRRDTTRHTEWYWLNIYDEDGEIGKQAGWKPEEKLSNMYHQIAYNMFMGKINESFRPDPEQQEVHRQNEARLAILRKKQGSQIEHYKDELMTDLHMDVDKAMALNGGVDTNIYNV